MSSTTEYEVWYDHVDGSRRHAKATSKEGVAEIVSGIEREEGDRKLLATVVGLKYIEHDSNIEVQKVTVTTEKVKS